MKRLWRSLFASWLVTAPTWAAVDLAACEDQAQSFGDGHGRAAIDPDCIGLWRHAGVLRSSADGALTAIARRNLVFLVPSDPSAHPVRVLAGEYTTLKDVVSVTVDSANKEVLVLESNGDILTFSSYITGNVAPLRVIRAKELEGATDLALDLDRKEVAAYNAKARAIYHFPRQADIFGRDGEKSVRILRRRENLPEHVLGLKYDPVAKQVMPATAVEVR